MDSRDIGFPILDSAGTKEIASRILYFIASAEQSSTGLI